MHRDRLLIVAAFMTGMLAGMLAAGDYKGGIEPGEVAAPAVAEPVPQPRGEEAAAKAASISTPPAARTTAEASPGADPVAADLETRLREATAAASRLQGDLAQLQGRVMRLEQRLAAVSGAAPEPAPPRRAETPEDRRTALVKAGVEEAAATDFIWRQGQHELDRLELRDLAIREGWFGSDRYREESGRLDEETPDLRAEIGDDAYDRYLFAAGQENRVRIAAVIGGSVAQEAGLQAGDLVETYGGVRVFSYAELREATAAGERGESVALRLRRADGSRVDVWLPRGPLGVRLDLARADPDA